jgi:hypothetical protein
VSAASSRRQQGLPDRVTDPAILAQVAALLRLSGKQKSRRP